MNNFVNFLLDYYVWILVILGIVIVTIIGFLVDSKQKRKKKENEQQSISLNEVKTVEPFPNSNVNDNVVENSESNLQSQFNNMSNFDNTNIVQQSQVPISQNIGTSESNIVNNGSIQDNVVNKEVSLSLSGQKPHFESREVMIPTSTQQSFVNNEKIVVPQPVNAVSINQPLQQQSLQPLVPQQNIVQTQQMQNFQQGYSNNMNSVVQQNGRTLSSNNGLMNSQNIQPMNNSQSVMSNVGTIQQPINYQNNLVSAHQSVSQPQIVSGTQTAFVPNNLVQQQPLTSGNNITVGVTNSQPVMNSSVGQNQNVTATPNIGINFVTGASTNTNDDTWKL